MLHFVYYFFGEIMDAIEYALTVFLVAVMIALTVVAFAVGAAFFINLYKQIREIKRDDKW